MFTVLSSFHDTPFAEKKCLRLEDMYGATIRTCWINGQWGLMGINGD